MTTPAPNPITPARLAETTYALYAGPEHITTTPFGRLAADPRCPTEWRFFDAHCGPDQVDALLQTVDACYPPEQKVRAIVGHDPATCTYLHPHLTRLGYQFFEQQLLVHEHPPELTANPAVTIQAVDAATDQAYYNVGLKQASPLVHEHRRIQDIRLGGEGLIAWLDGEPVGYGGWFIHGGLVRYRRLGTLPHARKKHVCTTIVRYVQNHPTVRAQQALIIGGSGGATGTTGIYQRCGFVQRGSLWMFVLVPKP